MEVDALEPSLGYSPIDPSPSVDAPAPPSPEIPPFHVKDALSYLEMVKLQSQDEPEIYGRFLDILKAFEAGEIDTLGVIDQISSLCSGHPALIQGFNTFLPLGYCIDCTADNLITVITPSGIQTRVFPAIPPKEFASSSATNLTQEDAPPIVELNQVVNYVEKIKQRFASDPNVYKQFFEILQVFKGQPDLLEEFQHSLSDHGGNGENISGQLAGGNGTLFGEMDQVQPTNGNGNLFSAKDKSINMKGGDDGIPFTRNLRRIEDIPNPSPAILQKRQSREDPEVALWEPYPGELPTMRSEPDLGTIDLPIASASSFFSDSTTQAAPPPFKRAGTDSGIQAHSTQRMSGLSLGPPGPGDRPVRTEGSILPIREVRNTTSDMFECLVNHGCSDLRTSIDPSSFSSYRVAEGGFGDVWKGILTGGPDVAIKVLRCSSLRGGESKGIKRAMREIYNWSKLEHKNIHKLLGVTMFQGRLGMVSAWMEHGTLRHYLDQYTDLDRHELCNILVSSDGNLKLTDFDYSIISDCSVEFSATTRGSGGTLRWMAPELLMEEDHVERSKHTDVYALGMTFLETVTNNIPYSECLRDNQIYRKLDRKEHPKRPIEYFPVNRLGNSMWELLVKCWNHDPPSRPTADQILAILKTEIRHAK
ncbi:Paired amphipathic helix protein pst3 AltName: Full=SIN3 homolog 3 [Rhizoctonia solani AG-1 IB]|uniref:ACL004Wp protein n=1 Tax=Thanatephorus cucumeris (strain AG1-IB / isolate 7/3/14) TaxID=1108050 RepID=M5BSE3_THACB|nr:Paired amphipathic helix protein pst3 AltName: Full=SIN3 homolog 3 [Rhizoctonia solani AG-1 IB]